MTATLEFRTAIFKALQGKILYYDILIPVYEEWVQETQGNEIAKIAIGAYDVEFYIILKNQTENEGNYGGKCSESVSSSIQVQIKSVFPANSGGSKHAELIGKLVNKALFNGRDIKIELPETLQVSKGQIEGAYNLNYNNESKHEWVHQLVVSARLTEKS